MKKIIYILILTITTLISCNDEIFDTAPTTSLTNDVYWTSQEDFRLYLNSFYTMFTGHSTQWSGSPVVEHDAQSDNLVPEEINEIAAGLHIVPSTDPTARGRYDYDFEIAREINILLYNAKNTDVEPVFLNPLVAEAKFFKALWYSWKVRTYGDYPWLTTELNIDSPELYYPKTPRKEVMDSILANINYAIDYLPDNTNNHGYINRNMALAAKARMFLYEGTYMKYHGTGTPAEYLQAAYDAAKELMDGGNYRLEDDFRTLFSQADKTNSPEGILVKNYEHDLVTTAVQRQLQDNNRGFSVSKSLVDAFLDAEGKPISQSTSYDESEGWLTEFNNRDPRLSVTASAPSSDLLQGINPPIIGANNTNIYGVTATGYYIEKHWERNEEEYNLAQLAAFDAFVYRYGEILLIYAEAAYELGILDQAKLDISINLLRDRVGMPHMIISELVKDANSDFPEIDVVLDEIRRERRVELAVEGLRYDDLMRWQAGHLLEKRLRGMKFIPSMYPNIDINTASQLQLDEDGYIWPYALALPQGRVFNESKHYLFPLPLDELTLNENVTQNPGW